MPQTGPVQKSQLTAFFVISGLLAFYGTLLLLTQLFPGPFSDKELALRVQQYRYPVLDWLALGIGELGKVHMVIFKAMVPALLLIFYGYKREAFFLMSTLLADISNLIIKSLIGRGRPSSDLLKVFHEASNEGFPSGHTLNFAVYFGFLIVLLPVFKNLGPVLRYVLTAVFILLIILAPWARVYKGMHWPSDTIGGGYYSVIFLAMLFFAYLYPNKPKLNIR